MFSKCDRSPLVPNEYAYICLRRQSLDLIMFERDFRLEHNLMTSKFMLTSFMNTFGETNTFH